MKTYFTHSMNSNGTMSEHDNEHMDHCIEYMRQSVICNADLALETSYETNKGHRYVTGWETTHVCNDWTELMTWSANNRFTDHEHLFSDLR